MKNKKIKITIIIILFVIVTIGAVLIVNIINEKRKIEIYQNAEAYYHSNQFESAVEAYLSIIDYNDSKTRLCESFFKLAKQQYDNKDYQSALKNFESCLDLDVSHQEECKVFINSLTFKDLSNSNVGDIVLMGSYPNKDDNDIQPIPWIILDKKDGKVFLLSEPIIDYYIDRSDVFVNKANTWTNSDIRTWLNKDFYNTAFNNEEKARIQETDNVNLDCLYTMSIDDNEDLSNSPKYEENTKDKVFLISYDEAIKYLDLDNISVDVTPYAKSHLDEGSGTDDDGWHYCWTTRTANTAYRNYNIDYDYLFLLSIVHSEDYPTHGFAEWGPYIGVRPAVWVLEK